MCIRDSNIGIVVNTTVIASISLCMAYIRYPVSYTHLDVYKRQGLSIGLTTGGTVLIGQYFGANRKRDVVHAIKTAVIIFSLLALLMTGATLLLLGPICTLMRVPPEDVYKRQNLRKNMAQSRFYTLRRRPIIFIWQDNFWNIPYGFAIFFPRLSWKTDGNGPVSYTHLRLYN